MNVVLVRTFLEILKAGSMNKAAEQLHVTQSTVTTRLNVLEEQLRQRLIIRSKSGVELTNAGFKFQRYAESFVQTWHQAQGCDVFGETPGIGRDNHAAQGMADEMGGMKLEFDSKRFQVVYQIIDRVWTRTV